MGKRRRSRSGLTAKDVIVPVMGVIIITLLLVGTFQVATNSGWTFRGVSLPPWMTGQGGAPSTGTSVFTVTGTNGVVSTITGTGGGQTIIPSGIVSFKMVAVAENSDGTNTTVFERSTLPAFSGYSSSR